MCGIAGWVSFDGDLRQQRATAQAMTGTMACRGPDDEGLYLREHVALGHRRLAVIDVAHGRQPMALATSGALGAGPDADRVTDDELAIVYSGEVYDFREHRSALGGRFDTDSDTEVVLRAHRAAGDRDPREVVAGFNGMFAYALWDTRREELLLVRDRLGVKPLYYRQTPDGVLFGSEPKAVLAHPDVPRVVDAAGLRQVFGMVADPAHTPFAGLREVPPGHVVRISRSGVQELRYWALESTPHTDDVDATVARVREILDDTARRQLIADVPLCTLLSGGLDSSALTALAARQLAEAGQGPVRSFSVDFAGNDTDFVPDDVRGTPDAPYVRDVAAHVRSDHTDVVLDDAGLLDPAARDAVLRARDTPGMGEIDTSLHLLFGAVRKSSTVALSGESADEVFGGYIDFHDPVATGADTFPWLAGRMIAGYSAGDLLHERVAKELDLTGHVDDAYRQTMAEVPRLAGETGHDARMREVSYAYLTRFLPVLLDRKDRMSMAVGLEVRVPFCDHRLVQYVFNAPWHLKNFDGREKSLLRAATADLLPQSVVERVKSPYPSTQDPRYAAEISRRFGALADDTSSPLADLVDLDAGREAPRNVQDRLLFVDRWLREYDVDVQL
ncbi:asparagine synthase (glutamine-hydrolysing) [Klenkia soli]|uniref:asparagine synthase (glutamine-hydrolyzing) n=1 Tax=Klenkia soli TaxID=1052260 RepID=A0A1H0MCA3_9ACTN|nr:asparagine synthase (glutamine-hydrolyzing) [Klenkia soli]SDO78062.1 asparagine synthase (glutamine-hydrolysing) [Klenkia soli]